MIWKIIYLEYMLKVTSQIKLIKGKALGKHNLQWNIAASVLLNLLISGNEICHTTDAPSAWAEVYS